MTMIKFHQTIGEPVYVSPEDVVAVESDMGCFSTILLRSGLVYHVQESVGEVCEELKEAPRVQEGRIADR